MTLTQHRPAPRGRGSPQETRSINDPDGQRQDGSPFSRALCLTQEGGPRPRWPLQYDETGWRLLEGSVSSSVSYSP
jgi:hypothetical protein